MDFKSVISLKQPSCIMSKLALASRKPKNMNLVRQEKNNIKENLLKANEYC